MGIFPLATPFIYERKHSMSSQDRKAYMREYMKTYRAKNKGNATSKRFSISVSSSDHKKLKSAAKKNKKSLSKYTKELALISLYERENYPLDVSASLADLTHILRGIGNNINQIARHSNTFKTFTQDKEVALKLKLLEDTIKEYTASHQIRNSYDHQVNE